MAVDGASFRPEELLDLETFAGQAAVAVESSWQWETIRDAHQRLSFHVNRMPLGYIVWEVKTSGWWSGIPRRSGSSAGHRKRRAGRDAVRVDRAVVGKGARGEEVWKKLMLGAEDSYSLNANVRKDGKVITCEWFNTPLRDAQGDISGILTMVHDVTEKTQLERQLQTAQRLEAVGTLAGGSRTTSTTLLRGSSVSPTCSSCVWAKTKRHCRISPKSFVARERAADTLTRQLLTYSRRQIMNPRSIWA